MIRLIIFLLYLIGLIVIGALQAYGFYKEFLAIVFLVGFVSIPFVIWGLFLNTNKKTKK